jgi:hypothetical protein
VVVTYFIYSPATDRVKIGRSVAFKKRFRHLQMASPDDLEVIGTLPGDFELEYHKMHRNSRVKGEWFDYSPRLRFHLLTVFGEVARKAGRKPTRSRAGRIHAVPERRAS